MLTECNGTLFDFAPVEGRQVVAAFDGGTSIRDFGCRGRPPLLKNAARVPVLTVKGLTADMSSSCSRCRSSVDLTTISREPDRRGRDVVILECLQRPRRGVFLGHNCGCRRIYLVQLVRADELLQ